MYTSRPAGFSTKLIHCGSREHGDSKQNLIEFSKIQLNSNEKELLEEEHFLNSKLAALDNVKYAITFSSGVAATAALFSLLKFGDHILVTSDIYGGTEDLIRTFLSKFGVEHTFLSDLSDMNIISKSIKTNTKVRNLIILFY